MYCELIEANKSPLIICASQNAKSTLLHGQESKRSHLPHPHKQQWNKERSSEVKMSTIECWKGKSQTFQGEGSRDPC